MFKSFSMELAGRTLTVEVGRVASRQTDAAFMHYGVQLFFLPQLHLTNRGTESISSR